MKIMNNVEKGPQFIEAKLGVVKKEGKHHMIWLQEPIDGNQSSAYDEAIKTIADEKRLSVFHQVGSDDMGGPQGWEFWYPDDEEKISALIPEIHAKAREFFESWN